MDIEIDADGRLRVRATRLGPGARPADPPARRGADDDGARNPAPQDDAVDAVTFTVQDDPEAYVTRDADGRVGIGLRHAGFGWIAFAFTEHERSRRSGSNWARS